MRYFQLLEAIDFSDLVNQASTTLAVSLKKFAAKEVDLYDQYATADRRKQLGYAPYDNMRTEHDKPFDYDAFAAQNEKDDWSVAQAVLDNVTKRESNQHSYAYAMMGHVSKELTALTRAHVKQKFGDPIVLRGQERPVEEIDVVVWWTALRADMERNQGYFSSNEFDVNKKSHKSIRVFVKVDRDHWIAQWKEVVFALVTGEGYDFNAGFISELMDTFAHEYSHLEQAVREPNDIKHLNAVSSRFKNAKGHSRRGRGGYNTDDPTYALWTGRRIEIGASAQGAAANIAHQINVRYARHNMFSFERSRAIYFNRDIKQAINDAVGGYVPDASRFIDTLPKTLTDAEKTAIKQRFLKFYVAALQRYLKPVPAKTEDWEDDE